jgi:diphosphomevalonate decarboxylase
MDKAAVVQKMLKAYAKEPQNREGTFFAPSNIALCKYWGKRNIELNLPVTASLSISLGRYGAKTTISILNKGSKEASNDQIIVNGKQINIHRNPTFFLNLTQYLNLFRRNAETHFCVETEVNLPIGAGLASSACGYAALVGAIDKLYGWQLPLATLSVLARLGSGSASRSFWQGFVEWQRGVLEEGEDSIGVSLPQIWPELRIGLLILNSAQKRISSRKAMEITKSTSPFYGAWPEKHAHDLARLKEAIRLYNFVELGEASESNALAMHAMMLTAYPSILYTEAKTITAMHEIWRARQAGLSVYFTQDAGPNLKLLFLDKDMDAVKTLFPELIVIAPFKEERLN